MKARTIWALLIVVAVACGAVLISGCANGHKEFLYVVGQGSNEVFEFNAKANGTLVPLGAPNFPAGANPAALQVHTSGDFLYVANFSGNDLTLLDINKGNGNLSVPVSNSVVAPVTPPNVFNTGAGPISMAMSPTEPFLYVANQTSGDISAFVVDPGAGGLATIGTFPLPSPPAPAPPPVMHPRALVVSPKGDLLFSANPAEGTVTVFSIGSKGDLTLAGTPVALGAGATPNSMAIEHSGRFLYVADTAHNAVLGFSIQGNGTLTAINGSPFAAGTAPNAIAADPQGSLLYAANTGSNNVSAYIIDSSTGALGAVNGSPFATGGAGPAALAVNSNSTVLYVTDSVSHDIAAMGILTSGALKPVTGSPFSVATSGSAVVLAVR